eukprot:3067288-Rhodomonas_salina.1
MAGYLAYVTDALMLIQEKEESVERALGSGRVDLKAYFTNGCSKCDQFVNRLANKSKQQEDPEQDLSCE